MIFASDFVEITLGNCYSYAFQEVFQKYLSMLHYHLTVFLTLIATMHSKVLCFGTQVMAGATAERRLHFWYSWSDLRHHLTLLAETANAATANSGEESCLGHLKEWMLNQPVSLFIPRHPNSAARRRVFMLVGPVSRSAKQTVQEEDRAFIAQEHLLRFPNVRVCPSHRIEENQREISLQSGSSQLCTLCSSHCLHKSKVSNKG